MPRFTPGQWLDLAAAVGLAAYAVLVLTVPSLAVLGDAFASPAAAGSMAAAAFMRFAGSVKGAATVIAVLLMSALASACATVTGSTAAASSAVDATRRAIEGLDGPDAEAAREILGHMAGDLQKLGKIAPALDAEITEHREGLSQ